MAQPQFLHRLLRQCRRREIPTAVDTCLHAPWETVEAAAHDAALFLVDLKQMDADVHRRLTGVSNELILDNLRRLSQRGAEIIIRMPIIPGVNDGDEHVVAAAEFLAGLGGIARIDILPYNEAVGGKLARLAKGYERPGYQPAGPERMAAIRRQLERFGFPVKIGG